MEGKRIHVLDQTTIDKIAAGEVVERPASVVKELTENAIDAGSSRITIEIKDGGISLIRITDNGRGIAGEDIPLAFLRHATSKITTVQDLSSLNSLGFRGEALSSIAAVSRVELITKQTEEISGSRYVIEGGREVTREEIGAPEGTTIVIRDIFFNTPARAKFLKTPMTEASHISSFVEQLILSNPDIAFQFIVNGQMKLFSPGNGSLKDAIYHIYGKDVVKELVEIRHEEEGILISGFVAKPAVSRGNRNYENYYINGRYVKSRILNRAIEDGFGTKLMQHQYPFSCLFLEVSGATVDVNVHPSKMEVRFSDEKKIYDVLTNAVKEALTSLDMIVASSLNPPEKKQDQVRKEALKQEEKLAPFEEKAVSLKTEQTGTQMIKENPVSYSGTSSESHSGVTSRKVGSNGVNHLNGDLQPKEAKINPETGELMEETKKRKSSSPVYEQQSFLPEFLSPDATPLRKIIGQVFMTYWIFEYEDNMYLMDQHAAHEKVLFERFMKAYHDRKLSSQMLNPPMMISVNAQEEQILTEYHDAFYELGFDIEHFGGREYAIHSVPYDMGSIDSGELFLSLLNELGNEKKLEDLEIYVHRVATEACKAAVKGGGRVSVEEAQSLVNQLFDCEDPYHCPHGRPTIISISKTDLEKRFKRIVS